MNSKCILIHHYLIGVMLLAPPVAGQAQFTFTTNNGAITITGYSGNTSALIIPSITNGYPVTGISSYAFYYNSSFTNVSIPSGITNIGNSAFSYCSSLTAITVDTNNHAFSSVGGVLFSKDITQLIQYPAGVTGVYTIPNGTTNILAGAFDGCGNLTSIAIPSSLISIGYAFQDCISLTAISVDTNNLFFSNAAGVLFNMGKTLIYQYPAGISSSSYTIPNGVTNIAPLAFTDCTGLKTITIPNSITSIGSYAFGDCDSVVSIAIPNGVTSIGDYAFEACDSLTNVAIPNGVTNIGNGAFFSDTSLINITIPNSVTSIGSYAFYYCYGLTGNITIPSGVTTINDFAFYECNGLVGNIVIPNGVTNIGTYAFSKCGRMNGVLIPNTVTNIGAYAFFNSSLTNVTVPGSVTTITDSVFRNCPKLASVTIGNGVRIIGSNAFNASYGLTNIIIPNTVTSIGDSAFYQSYLLPSIIIPSSVTNIGSKAFIFCTGLTSIYFIGNAPSVGADPNINLTAFADDPATVYYVPGTTGWSSTFVGLPTAFWFLPNPQILNGGPDFGVQSNRFSFTISWATNISVVVEACTNLSHPSWQPVSTNTLTGGTTYFGDSQWTNYPVRFYRIRSGP